MVWFPLILYLCFVVSVVFAQRTSDSESNNQVHSVRIGAIFDADQEDLADAFQDAVQHVNNDRNFLSRTKIVTSVELIKPHDSFHAAKIICNNLIREGVWALVGPESPSVGWLLRSMANNLHLPHFSVFWDHRSYHRTHQNLYASSASNFTLNLYPDASVLSKAFMDLVQSRNWKSFTLIFEQNEGLIKLKDLLTISSHPGIRKVKISIVQFDSNYQFDHKYQYTKILKNIKKTEHNIVLSVSNQRAVEFLEEAAQMERLTEYHNYLIASLDIHALNLSQFQNTKTNITGLTLLEPKGQEIGFVTRDWITGKMVHNIKRVVTTTTALLHDSVRLFARAVEDFHRNSKQSITSFPITCESKDPWPYGMTLINSMKMTSFQGMSGPLEVDKEGQRTDFTLNVVEFKKNGFEKVAKWTKRGGIRSITNYTSVYKEVLEVMKEKVLKVTVPRNVRPYIFLKENQEQLEGNDRFDGFCADLLIEISNVFEKDFKSKFLYEIHETKDPTNSNGKLNKDTGEWNGMIGELLRHQSDLALADLTATYAREKAVDFTMPFMNLGISILFKKPGLPEPKLFSFLKPFSVEVWLYLASAYLSISLLLWILSRLSPYEWISGHPCDPEPEELENQFSIGNSLWFTIGSLMQQGSDLAPRALSTRTLASIWWFFTLIMISSYTANLAASLTLSRMAPAISNVEDLAKQTVIQYGCKKDGSTYEFFKNSNHSTYQRMFNTMDDKSDAYMDVEEGKERVKKGLYAYLMESSTLEYEVHRDCDLIQIGNWLDNKGYGIACPPDSPYRTPISNAIVVLQDRGILYEIRDRWWIHKGGGICGDDPKPSSASELNIENVGGVFVVLVAGVAIGCVFAALEFIWKTMKVVRHQRDSMSKLIWLELARIFRGEGSTRPNSDNKNNNKSSIDSDSIREIRELESQIAQLNNKLARLLTNNGSINEQIIY